MKEDAHTMNNNDHYLRAIATAGGIRILACSCANLTREVVALQEASLPVSIALGRGLAAGALMGALLKADQRVALKFEGNGPLRKMIIEADGDGAVRGTVANPAATVEPRGGDWNIPALLGRAGFLTVSRDMGHGGQPYLGTVQLHNSEIGADLAFYLTESEQIPSAVGVGVSLAADGTVERCGGFLLQALPKADEAELTTLMHRLETLPPITSLLAQGGTELLLATVMGEIPYTRLESRELFFRCGCNREKVERALHSLGAAELADIRSRDGFAEVRCEFCRAAYQFAAAELQQLELLSTVTEQNS
jgi:molecular chaperone Hsp33